MMEGKDGMKGVEGWRKGAGGYDGEKGHENDFFLNEVKMGGRVEGERNIQ